MKEQNTQYEPILNPKKRIAKTLGLLGLLEMFPDEKSVVKYLERLRWGNTPTCTKCGSTEKLTPQKQLGQYWCKAGRHYFTAWHDTPLAYGKIPKRKWIVAAYLLMTARKGISSMQLSKELEIGQQAAWYMLHRLREACKADSTILSGIIEIDETYIGGKQKHRHPSKPRHRPGGGGKQIILGMRQRGGRLKAKPINKTNAPIINYEVDAMIEKGSTIYTDGHIAYYHLKKKYDHDEVNHSAGEYVRGAVHTNSIESVWAVLKRGYNGVYHHWSQKHMHRYINEFTFRLNDGNCEIDTEERISALFRGMVGQTMTYKELTR